MTRQASKTPYPDVGVDHASRGLPTSLPVYAPSCRAVADGDLRGTVDGLGCIIPL